MGRDAFYEMCHGAEAFDWGDILKLFNKDRKRHLMERIFSPYSLRLRCQTITPQTRKIPAGDLVSREEFVVESYAKTDEFKKELAEKLEAIEAKLKSVAEGRAHAQMTSLTYSVSRLEETLQDGCN